MAANLLRSSLLLPEELGENKKSGVTAKFCINFLGNGKIILCLNKLWL